MQDTLDELDGLRRPGTPDAAGRPDAAGEGGEPGVLCPATVRRGHRGQALVEAAVALPLLLLAAVGLVQFALVAHAYNVVTGAAQDGARVAAAVDRTLADGEAHTTALLRAGLGRSATVSVSGAQRPAGSPEVVEIAVQAGLQPIVPWLGEATIPLRSRAAMSKERFRTAW
jgi:hypothetical protein